MISDEEIMIRSRLKELKQQVERLQSQADRLQQSVNRIGAPKEIEIAIGTLRSIALFQEYYANSRPTVQHIQEMIRMLRRGWVAEQSAKSGPYGGLLYNLADAIAKAYLSQPAAVILGEAEKSELPAPEKSEPREGGG
ncbi:MAG: hypothetical protein HY246_25375 [Proteobacteria bacterium]|nr:hypothetical protein [Pseudomonadota bacterium]